MKEVEIKIKLVDENCMPYKKYETDSGMDLRARIPRLISLGQWDTKIIPSGICIELPEGYEAEIKPRSGLSSQGVVAEIGTIDNEYRGEIGIILTNNSSKPYHIEPYERIAQLTIKEIIKPKLTITNSLTDTNRGSNGFGSTGRK